MPGQLFSGPLRGGISTRQAPTTCSPGRALIRPGVGDDRIEPTIGWGPWVEPCGGRNCPSRGH
eukprot:2768822-Pyramimonas_sp.AAC.1